MQILETVTPSPTWVGQHRVKALQSVTAMRHDDLHAAADTSRQHRRNGTRKLSSSSAMTPDFEGKSFDFNL
jgi:hypothetical protein